MPKSQLAIHGGTPIRTKPWPPRALFGEEEKQAVIDLFDQAIASGTAFGYEGPTERAYCEEFAEFLGGGYVDAVNSGTNAVYVALRALNPEPYTEIIVSPITDQGGVMPVPLLNCIPVVADTAPGSFNVGPEQIEAAITPLTSAIVVAHIMGEPADMEGIMAVARRHNIPVVEDCAQAHGAKLNGQYLGTFSEVSAFSTMFGKHHATGSQGGLVFTKDEDLYVKIRQASDRGKPFGLPAGSTNTMATLNFNLGDLGAAIGRVQLKKLPQIVGKRQEVAKAIIAGIEDIAAVSAPEQLPGAEPSYWYLRLRVNEEHLSCTKREFCAALAAEGISHNPEYAALPHRTQWFRERRVFGTTELPWSSPLYRGQAPREFPCPNAMQAVASHFLLPVSESWGEEEIRDVVEAIRKVVNAFAV
ncbi:MAG: DegT/DnrJ/EryC1/StrS family aminotransferase [Firmicutes bacterium]|jgi:dTDP-4-amino-4,6-dideoxygalactose transaminase|nr:DegT/DnrJ/EryC1/StrS family aminotransferase [Bacillota bacterium]